MLPPCPLSQREHPHAGTDGRVSPSLISLKYCYVPLSGRGPPIAHDVRLETRALFAFTEGYAAEWTIGQLREPAQRIADRIEELMNDNGADTA